MTRRLIVAIASCLAFGRGASAQQDARSANPGQGLQLSNLQQAAVEHDPRFRKLELQAEKSELELKNIAAERGPSVSAQGLLQYQSDVPTPPPFLPGGQPLFLPPKGTVDAYLRVDQPLWNPSVGPRLALEQAALTEQQASVRTALYALRQEVNDAFFAAALLQQRAGALGATIADLESRLAEAAVRVREGTALPSDAAMLEATLLQRRQDDEQLRVDRASAFDRLSTVTGQAITVDDVLDLPDLRAAVAAAMPTASTARERPEFQQFARARERLSRQQDVATAQDRPRVSLYARGGVGRPGLNFISDEFQVYGLAGLQMQWNFWNGGTSGRQREVLAVEQQIVLADEASFARNIRVASDADRATVERLERAVALDDRIVSLREEVVRTAEVRLQEAVITPAEYLERSTELLQARFAGAGHRVELAQASARLLTTLGREVR